MDHTGKRLERTSLKKERKKERIYTIDIHFPSLITFHTLSTNSIIRIHGIVPLRLHPSPNDRVSDMGHDGSLQGGPFQS